MTQTILLHRVERHPPTSRIALATAIAIVGAIALAPAAAQAGVGLSVTPRFPTNSTVGQTALAANLTITNANNGTDVSATICNSGDAAPCAFSGEGITLMGSCAAQGGDAACTAADPGVFKISPTAAGAASTACAGMAFTVSSGSGAFGKVRFTPAGGAHVTLPTPAATCVIAFTVDVLKTPVTDAQPAVPGLQTIQVADALQRSNNGTTGFARGSQTGATVNPPPPVVPPPPPVAPPPPPVAPPPPPPVVCTPPPGPAPAGGELCATPVRGKAAVNSGGTSCKIVPFYVTVNGRAISKVVFRLDGRRVKTLTKPNRSGKRYGMLITPRLQRFGMHRLTATTTFTKASTTKSKILRVAYRRCARQAVLPEFTG